MGFLYCTEAVVKSCHDAQLLKLRYLTGNKDHTDWREKKKNLRTQVLYLLQDLVGYLKSIYFKFF